jgi:hypothetical protein
MVLKLVRSNLHEASLIYARSAQPLEPEMGWLREDVQLAFFAGAEHRAAQRSIIPRTTEVFDEQP